MSSSPANTVAADGMPRVAQWPRSLGVGLIAVAAIICYWPALGGDFLWDDDALVTNSPMVKDPGGLASIWFTKEAIDYWPVSNTSLWLEWRLWGGHPTGYHVTNLLLHVLGSLLVWAVLQKLSIPGAFLAGLLFAVHPVNVEAVAWIAQRKTVLALVFFLLSMLCYLKAEDARSPTADERRLFAAGAGHWYWLSLTMCVLAILSKGSVVILPLVLLLIVWWQRNRLTKWDIVRTAPFFAVAVPLVLVNMWFQTHGSGEVIRSASLLERLLGAAAAVWFYLYKAFLPINLMFVYPKWQISVSNPLWWLPLLAAIAATGALWQLRAMQFGRPLLFAWTYYCLALVPVLGFADVYFMKYSLVADHYQNLALIAVVALVAAVWSIWRERLPGAALAVASLVVVVLGGMSMAQATMYRDAETLWRTTIARNPDATMAHNNLGQLLLNRGDVAEATEQFQRVVELEPGSSEGRGNLGMALRRAGREQDGIMQLRLAVQTDPTWAKGHYDLGSALLFAYQLPEAIRELQEAIRLNPKLVEAHHNLALALFSTGRQQEGIEQFHAVFELQPDFPGGHRNFGRALFNMGEKEESLKQFRLAVDQSPQDLESRNDLAGALASLGRATEALEQLQQALQIQPNSADAHHRLGVALLQAGQAKEAIEHLEYWLRSAPESVEAWSTLASATAQANRPAEALAAGQKAMELARAQGKTDLAAQLEAWVSELRAMPSIPAPALPPP